MDKGLSRGGVHTSVFPCVPQIQVPVYTSYFMEFWNLEAIYLVLKKIPDLSISQKKKKTPNLSVI